jgi:predicted ATPase
MNNIRRICFFGPPGSGKTTLSAKLFADLKIAGFNIALMDEYIQKYIRNGTDIQSFDQFYVFAKLLNQEDIALRSDFDLVITDAPLLINVFYTKLRNDAFWEDQLSIAKKFEEEYPSLNIFLTAEKDKNKYNNKGRIHRFDQAVEMEKDMINFMSLYSDIKIFGRDDYNELKEFILEKITPEPENPKKECEKCGGAGWVWGYELENPTEDDYNNDTRYSCDKCSDWTKETEGE